MRSLPYVVCIGLLTLCGPALARGSSAEQEAPPAGSNAEAPAVVWIHDHFMRGGSVSVPFHGNGVSRANAPVARSTPITAGLSTGKSVEPTTFAITRMSRSIAVSI